MKKELIQFGGLYGDTQTLYFPNFLHHELLETRSKIYNWEIKEHLHTDLFQLFLIQKGKGIVSCSNQKIKIESPCIVLIPSNTLHGFSFEPEITGDVITFSESFLEKILKENPKILLELIKFRLLVFEENQKIFERIKELKTELLTEIYEENVEKQTVIPLLFQLLFVQIYRQSVADQSEMSIADNRTLRHFQLYQKKIRQTITETKSVSEYADELNISVIHLNRICQNLVNKSALQIIHEHLIEEVKRYLLNTDYSISEVSHLLNFSEPAYFTRFFKKMTGLSPSDFKRK